MPPANRSKNRHSGEDSSGAVAAASSGGLNLFTTVRHAFRRHLYWREMTQRSGRHGSAGTSAGRLLVVEDDPDIAALLAHSMKKAGFEVDIRHTGAGVVARIQHDAPDLLLLDLMLPGIDGRDICRALRADPKTAAVPIIMLTARGEEEDRIGGLELGADDYITKPFSPKEVVARVRALLRRTTRSIGAGGDTVLRYGTLAVDLERHVVTANAKEVHLTAKEFLLLHYFLEHRGRVLSRDLLLSDVWGYRYTGGTRTVDVHVRRLREKVPSVAACIITVKQFGYRLLEEPV
jgi:DNA-binding response OmpR family regulator